MARDEDLHELSKNEASFARQPAAARFVSAMTLRSDLRRQLEKSSLSQLPEEACGLLLGPKSARGSVPTPEQVEAVTCARNVAPQHRERCFELDPEHLLQHEGAAMRGGLAVLGVWHSHPGGGSQPSAADRRAALPGLLYVIVAVDA
jgi:proteasome lid subunit RPN8/RPN11